MIQINKKEDCCGCHACMNICPTHSIAMIADHEGFLYPQVDTTTCTGCGLCETVCPMTKPIPVGEPPQTFAAYNMDEAIRSDSSSGGVFNALMRHAFHQDSVVFGAAFDESLNLCHQSAENEYDGIKFRGSKYLQSQIGKSYRTVKDTLKQDRKVLFSGTPCQVAGLYGFLGGDHQLLLTCDLVCHGVPSPKVFTAYRAVLERRYAASTQRIAFRRKDCGWKRYSVSLSFDNDTEYLRVLTEDPYMYGFLSNTYLRPSCHACRFSRLPRVADISMGDFWGVDKHHPDWNDDKGLSLILVQTEKGQKAFEACSDELTIHQADLDTAIQSNPCIRSSVAPGKRREAFFVDLERLPFEKMIKKYMMRPSLGQRAFNRVFNKIKRMVRY